MFDETGIKKMGPYHWEYHASYTAMETALNIGDDYLIAVLMDLDILPAKCSVHRKGDLFCLTVGTKARLIKFIKDLNNHLTTLD